MNRFSQIPTDVQLFAQLADLKEVDYKNTLIITALVELLVEKGIVTRREVLDKAQQLDSEFHFDTETAPHS
jgi:hypothetical protein